MHPVINVPIDIKAEREADSHQDLLYQFNELAKAMRNDLHSELIDHSISKFKKLLRAMPANYETIENISEELLPSAHYRAESLILLDCIEALLGLKK